MNDFEEKIQGLAVTNYVRNSSTGKPTTTPSEATLSSSSSCPSTAPSLAPISCPEKQLLSKPLAFSTLDVFTTKRFQGNQLAIVHVPPNPSIQAALTKDVKQSIAREFNFSETVFLHDRVPATWDHRVEIFTPMAELSFAGHPVIGTICYLCQRVEPPLMKVTLLCNAGPVLGIYNDDVGIAVAGIPHNVRVHREHVSSQLVFKSQAYLLWTNLLSPTFPVVSIVKGMAFILINLPSVTPYLEQLNPGSFDYDASIVSFDEGWGDSFVGIYFYAYTSHPNEIVTTIRARMLEQNMGEDAATGSAASTLACFLALKGGEPHTTYRFKIQQGVEMGRASDIRVDVLLDASGKAVREVKLIGSAVLVTQGTVILPEA